MRFPIVALAVVVAFLATLDASSLLVQAASDKLTSGRSLRIAAGTGLEQDEERNSLVTKIRTTFSKKARVDEWAKAEKSDDFVRKMLKLENVADNNLWAMKNYPLYLRFLEKAEAKKISNWLADDVSTYSAWVKLGLNSLDDMDKVKRATALNTYKKFVEEYDNKVITMFNEKKIPVPVAEATSRAEMNARMDVLASMERGEAYVKHVLGMNKLREGAIMKHANYQYLDRYRRAADKFEKSNKNRLPTIAER